MGLFMRSGRFAFVLALFTTLATGALAQPFETPEALIEALYAPYLADSDPIDRDVFFSDGLTRLYEVDAQQSQGEVGAIDFDPVINGQDWDITDLIVGETAGSDESVVVTVRFKNFGQFVTLRYGLVNENGNWQVDDIESVEGDNRWTLSEIFENAQY